MRLHLCCENDTDYFHMIFGKGVGGWIKVLYLFEKTLCKFFFCIILFSFFFFFYENLFYKDLLIKRERTFWSGDGINDTDDFL